MEKIPLKNVPTNEIEEFPADLNDPDVEAAFEHLLSLAKAQSENPELRKAPRQENSDTIKKDASKPVGIPTHRVIESVKEPAKEEPIIKARETIDSKRIPDMITSTLESATSMDRTIADWRSILTRECQVYVMDQQYIGKRFDQVHYKYMAIKEAEEVLRDNLYAILLYKYFSKITDEVLERIDDIVRNLTRNIKTFLTKISFNDELGAYQGFKVKRVPNSAVAFSNGIFDFRENKFIVKFERIYIPTISNTIILYNDYIIMWNFDFDFEPMPINIMETDFADFCEFLKKANLTQRNYCWELFYNMTHDALHRKNIKRMQHLAQIIGYTLIPQFLQYFVLLIGAGQNGKNSLFDGCFSARILPRPVSNSIEALEKDRFITESLENACHNIFLETSAKTYTDSNMLKALTGSMYQTIECKGIGKRAGIINCKYIFAGNDQSKIKFSDTTTGFRRRINIFEIYYSWDPDHRFLRRGDYYCTDFSGDLHEIKEDISNAVVYLYLGMYGIRLATNNFTRDFKFEYNEWSDAYSDIDVNIKEYFEESLNPEDLFILWGNATCLDDNHQKIAFYSDNGKDRLYNVLDLKQKGIFNFDDAVKYFQASSTISVIDENGDDCSITESNAIQYLRNKDVYISLIYLRTLMTKSMQIGTSQREFNDMFKKIYPNASYASCAQREQYVLCRLMGNKIRFIDK